VENSKFETNLHPQRRGPKIVGVISPKNEKCREKRIVVVGIGRMVV
jgi:hypothetical protein